jgi:hypothetical protein
MSSPQLLLPAVIVVKCISCPFQISQTGTTTYPGCWDPVMQKKKDKPNDTLPPTHFLSLLFIDLPHSSSPLRCPRRRTTSQALSCLDAVALSDGRALRSSPQQPYSLLPGELASCVGVASPSPVGRACSCSSESILGRPPPPPFPQLRHNRHHLGRLHK